MGFTFHLKVCGTVLVLSHSMRGYGSDRLGIGKNAKQYKTNQPWIKWQGVGEVVGSPKAEEVGSPEASLGPSAAPLREGVPQAREETA